MSPAKWRSRTALVVAVALAVTVAAGMPAAAAAAGTLPATNPPVVTITSPASEWTFTANSATVGFTVNRNAKLIASETCSLTPTTTGTAVSVPCSPTPPTTGSTATNRAKTSATTSATTVASFPNVADGTYTFNATVTLLDGQTGTASEPITVTNSPPLYKVWVGGPTNATDSASNLTHPNVLVLPDFTDPLGYTLTLTVTSQPKYGTVTKDNNGVTFTYTPTADAQNNVETYDFDKVYLPGGLPATPPPTTDSFTVTATDGHGASTSAVVTVPISPYYDMNDVTITEPPGYDLPLIKLPLLNADPLTAYQSIIVGPGVTVETSLNLDTPSQFLTDPNVVSAVDNALGVSSSTPVTNIASCASDPTNTMCATPPPPLSPTASIPPMPLANYYGEQSGQAFLASVISEALAAAGAAGTILGTVIADALTVTEILLAAW